jgi:TolA-binding protein
MSDAPGASSVLGIEAVEWLAEGGENLTVRVTGRWRRRRPAWGAQPILVIEAAGRRFRFPAMPEPPSLTGAGPGMWRMSFAVPAALAPELGGRNWLQFGAVTVPLPAAAAPLVDMAPSAEAGPAATGDEPDPPAVAPAGMAPETSGPPSSEVEAEGVRRRAVEAEHAAAELVSRVQDLEHDLAVAQRDAERLTALLSEREQTRRVAEQRAHAEQALRQDLARQLASRAAQSDRVREVLGDLAAAEDRIRALERDLHDARRRGDEAEQIAAAAVAARERAESAAHGAPASRDPVPGDVLAPGPGERDRLRLEHDLIVGHSTAQQRVPVEPAHVAVRAAPPRVMPEVSAAAPDALAAALRHELTVRAVAEGALRARLVDAEGRLASRVLIERRTAGILAQLRAELDGLRTAFARERDERLEAERHAAELSADAIGGRLRSRQAYDAIVDLREALEGLLPGHPARTADPAQPIDPAQPADPGDAGPPAAPESSSSTSPAAGPGAEAGESVVEPGRLNDARLRLRQTAELREQGVGAQSAVAAVGPAAVPAPEESRTARAWLEPPWNELVRTDPGAAGRLLMDLLPAQREAAPERVRYDLVFESRRGCARVTVDDGAPVLVRAREPRPAAEVDFQVVGDPAAIARLLTAGPWRRRFGRGVARVRGRRRGLAALRALPGVRLDLIGLHRVGVRLEPELILRLVAMMIEPSWTEREQFALRFVSEDALYLVVRPGVAAAVVDEAPASGVTTTISASAEGLMLALAGGPASNVEITGEDWPLVLLRKWIKRAQSG